MKQSFIRIIYVKKTGFEDMVRVITVKDACELIRKVSLKTFLERLIDQLESDFARWEEFDKRPRVANHFPDGVIELMPASDGSSYAFKFVNGHPKNPESRKQTVAAFGALADVSNGYPCLISEMTLLTAIRTAAVSAMASKYLAPQKAQTFGIIGTGAQGEFQVLAHYFAMGVREINYFDTDTAAMDKFANNLQQFGLKLNRLSDAQSVVERSQIVTTATAAKSRNKVVKNEWVKTGSHVNAIGGDCPDKTELELELLSRSKVFVEHTPQTRVEGEIQAAAQDTVYTELWEVIKGNKPGRESPEEITLFDSVGFAIEDYSTLQVVNRLAEEFGIGHLLDMVPENNDPKDLFSLLDRS